MLGVGIYRGQILPLPQMKRSEMQWSIYKAHNLFVILFLCQENRRYSVCLSLCQEKQTHIYFTQSVLSRLKTLYVINQSECIAKRLQRRQIKRRTTFHQVYPSLALIVKSLTVNLIVYHRRHKIVAAIQILYRGICSQHFFQWNSAHHRLSAHKCELLHLRQFIHAL